MGFLDAQLVPAVDGVAYGLLLFVVAAGLSLAFGTARVLNLSHGTLYAVGAYTGAELGDGTWGGFLLGLAAGTAAATLAGVLLSAATAPLARRGHLAQALLTFGLALVGGNLLVEYFGEDEVPVRIPAALDSTVTLLGHRYPAYRLGFIGMALLLAAVGTWALTRTRAGAAVRAAADDPQMLAATGISPRAVHTGVLAVSGALAGAAGVLGAPIIGPGPNTAETVLMLSLVIVVLGGLRSLWSTLAAALAVGEVQTLGVSLVPDWAPYLLFAAMAGVLVLRSQLTTEPEGAGHEESGAGGGLARRVRQALAGVRERAAGPGQLADPAGQPTQHVRGLAEEAGGATKSPADLAGQSAEDVRELAAEADPATKSDAAPGQLAKPAPQPARRIRELTSSIGSLADLLTAPLPPRLRGPLAAVAPFAVLFAVLAALPWTLDVYSLSLVGYALALGLLAVSVTVVTGYAGLPTLGQTAPFAVGAYATALLAGEGWTTGPLLVALAAAGAALFSLLTGPAVIRARGTTVLMITLAVGELTVVAIDSMGWLTGGTDGLVGFPALRWLPGTAELTDERALYGYTLAVAAVSVALTLLVLRSPAGRLLTGSRAAESRMRASGHPVGRYLLTAHIGAGALAGVGGSLMVTVQSYVSPADVGFETAAFALLAAVIGGTRSVLGALLGAGLIVFTRDWLAGAWPGHGPLLLGVLFVAAVYLLPRGLAGIRPRREASAVPYGARAKETEGAAA